MFSRPYFITRIAFVLLAVTTPLLADVTTYHGEWKIDVPATMEHARQSPKYKPEEAAMVEKHITRRAETMTLNIDGTRVAIIVGQRTLPFPYTVLSDTAAETKLSFTAGDQTGILTFTRIGEDRINFTSNRSDDMNFFVWKPAPKSPPAVSAPSSQ